jgi:hypothetical protein
MIATKQLRTEPAATPYHVVSRTSGLLTVQSCSRLHAEAMFGSAFHAAAVCTSSLPLVVQAISSNLIAFVNCTRCVFSVQYTG